MKDHPLLSFKSPVGIMTAENPRFPSAPGGNDALKRDLTNMGAHFEEVSGHYGSPENSLVIHGLPKHHLTHLGKKYGQEAVIHSENGQRHLIYTNGEKEGLAHPGDAKHEFWQEGAEDGPDDYYTHFPGQGKLRLHFDWDTLNPSGPLKKSNHNLYSDKGLQELGKATMADKKQVSLREGLYELHKSLKEQVESYEQKVASLRKKAEAEKAVKLAKGDDDGMAAPLAGGSLEMAEPSLAKCKVCGESGCDCDKAEKFAKAGLNLTKFEPGQGITPKPAPELAHHAAPSHPASFSLSPGPTAGHAPGAGPKVQTMAERVASKMPAGPKLPGAHLFGKGEPDMTKSNPGQERREQSEATMTKAGMPGMPKPAGAAPAMPKVPAAGGVKPPKAPSLGAGQPNLKSEKK